MKRQQGADDKKARAYELYRAMSDVDEKYVEQMLDEQLAESIRAANLRKRITVRRFAVSAVAVVAVAVSATLIPRYGLLNTSKDAGMKAENAEQFAADAQKDNSVLQSTQEQQTVQTEENNDGALPENFQSEQHFVNDGAAFEEYEQDNDAAADMDNATASPQPESGKAELDGGGSYIISDNTVDGSLAGEQLGVCTDGKIVYELSGIDPSAGAAVYDPRRDSYSFALNDPFRPQTLGDLISCLGMTTDIGCEYVYGSDIDGEQDMTAEEFLRQAREGIYKNADRYKLCGDTENTSGYTGYMLIIGGDAEYCRMRLTCYDDGVIKAEIPEMQVSLSFSEH